MFKTFVKSETETTMIPNHSGNHEEHISSEMKEFVSHFIRLRHLTYDKVFMLPLLEQLNMRNCH